MKQLLVLFAFFIACVLNACVQKSAATQKESSTSDSFVGGRCEGCEAIFETPVPFKKLSYVDTLPDFYEAGPKIMIHGTVYKADGKTPAENTILYVYHTDQTGHYTNRNKEKNWGARHGYIRGWMRTNEKGEYRFYTLRPASYPGTTALQHIHPTVKEADKNEYYIDEYLFADDPFIKKNQQAAEEARGGSGMVDLKNEHGIFTGKRDIYLGRNIPNYPSGKKSSLQSGLPVGANCPAFGPLHLTGADKDDTACPMCKYGKGQGVMVWFNHDNLEQMNLFAKALEATMQQRGEKDFRVFLIYMNPSNLAKDQTESKLMQDKHKQWAAAQNLSRTALVWVPSPADKETCGSYMINPAATNTVLVYKQRRLVAKWVNMDYNDEAVKSIAKAAL